MGAVTFPEPKVMDFIKNNIVAVRVPHDHQPLAKQFQVSWTPTLVTLDADGKEHYRTVGFLPPDELIPSLLLGSAKIHFDQGEFESAIKTLGTILKEYPKSGAAPEAIFLNGVCAYKHTNNPKPLKEAYEALQKNFPDSEWTKRALPYRLIP